METFAVSAILPSDLLSQQRLLNHNSKPTFLRNTLAKTRSIVDHHLSAYEQVIDIGFMALKKSMIIINYLNLLLYQDFINPVMS